MVVYHDILACFASSAIKIYIISLINFIIEKYNKIVIISHPLFWKYYLTINL